MAFPQFHSALGAPVGGTLHFTDRPCDHIHFSRQFAPSAQANTYQASTVGRIKLNNCSRPFRIISPTPHAASNDSHPAPSTPPHPPLGPCSQPQFDDMYLLLSTWRAKYRTTIVPGNAHDAPQLGAWAAAIRRQHRKGTLPSWAVTKLEELDMQWKVDVLDAKWHSNFHAAREFKEFHGGEGCDLDETLPPDYKVDGFEGEEAKADWIEAARWLDRQRDLYAGEKLTDHRVWMLKKVLGKI